MKVFDEFYEGGVVNGITNETYICLIPKNHNAIKVKEFRPISLTTSLYKILAKVLTNRLKKFLGKTIKENQCAFIKGGHILDCCLIANEVVEEYRRKQKKVWILKVDLEKAYDNVDWNFSDYVLHMKGFGVRWRRWITSCVSSVSFSVFINGREACHRVSGNTKMLWISIRIEINLDKSVVLGINFPEDEVDALALTIGCKKEIWPITYLGLPLGVLSALPSYFMSLFRVPRQVEKLMEKVMRDFLWDGADGDKHCHVVGWEYVTRPKDRGGLGLGNICLRNRALLGKWWWRGSVERDPLWKKVITSIYGLQDNGWDVGLARNATSRSPWKTGIKRTWAAKKQQGLDKLETRNRLSIK
ncbi:uncharacterized protein [Primulina eburnea]|uniref:uncharacterized protein n=1 Tax=Primulina eburnea TaxID=1245227 RepID=UPI003C6C3C31